MGVPGLREMHRAAQAPIFRPASRKAMRNQVTATSTAGSKARGRHRGAGCMGHMGTGDWRAQGRKRPLELKRLRDGTNREGQTSGQKQISRSGEKPRQVDPGKKSAPRKVRGWTRESAPHATAPALLPDVRVPDSQRGGERAESLTHGAVSAGGAPNRYTKQRLNSVEAQVVPGDRAGAAAAVGLEGRGGGTGASAAERVFPPATCLLLKETTCTHLSSLHKYLPASLLGQVLRLPGAQASARQTQGGPRCRPCTQHPCGGPARDERPRSLTQLHKTLCGGPRESKEIAKPISGFQNTRTSEIIRH